MANRIKDYQAFYDGVAESYHGLRYGGRYGRLFQALHHGVLRHVLGEEECGRVLEVACGTGHATALLRDMNLDFVSCDLTAAMLDRTRQRLGRAIPLIRANARRMPFLEASFDTVISTRFLHLFDMGQQESVLSEMVRVLKPGGRLIVDFDNLASRWLLALPHLIYNLVFYRRLAPDTHYNRVAATEILLESMGIHIVNTYGVGGYLLVLPSLFSEDFAIRLGLAHRNLPLRLLAEQFVIVGRKPV